MYNNELVGVGIATYNRQFLFKQLFDKVKNNSIVDFIAIVKNKDIDYGKDSPTLLANNTNIFSYNVLDDIGVGYCKNVCLKKLLDLGCKHIFIIEDDVDITNDDVFNQFILTAHEFNIGHMNWNSIPSVKNNAIYTIISNDIAIDICSRLCGSFSYFSREALQYCGIINTSFINALEHVEHAYRIAINKFAPPFYAFPQIHDCHNYLKDCGEQSTIDHDSPLYNKHLITGCQYFKELYGKSLNEMSIPTMDVVKQYLIEQIIYKNKNSNVVHE